MKPYGQERYHPRLFKFERQNHPKVKLRMDETQLLRGNDGFIHFVNQGSDLARISERDLDLLLAVKS